jgi:hypothetical protein
MERSRETMELRRESRPGLKTQATLGVPTEPRKKPDCGPGRDHRP